MFYNVQYMVLYPIIDRIKYDVKDLKYIKIIFKNYFKRDHF